MDFATASSQDIHAYLLDGGAGHPFSSTEVLKVVDRLIQAEQDREAAVTNEATVVADKDRLDFELADVKQQRDHAHAELARAARGPA